MKNIISILLFAFIGLVSSYINNDTFPIDIAQVSGLLHEYTAKQDVMFIFPQTNINPSSIKHVVIKVEGSYDIYPLNIVCNYKKELYPNSFVKCQIDLSNVPQGFYKVILLIYGTEHYKINHNLPFLILGEEKPEKPIELNDVIANITEYSRNQDIRFLFSKNEINPQLIRSMVISGDRYNSYNISLYCPYGGNTTWIKCYGDFSRIKAQRYTIQSIDYTLNYTFPSRTLYIEVHKKPEEELKLIDIRGYAFRENSTLNLTFNKNVIGDWFSFFYLYDRYNFYNLTTTIYNKYSNNTIITAEFDFSKVPVGAYNFGTMYMGVDYTFSNIFVNITDYNRTNSRWKLSNILYSFIGAKTRPKSNLRMLKK